MIGIVIQAAIFGLQYVRCGADTVAAVEEKEKNAQASYSYRWPVFSFVPGLSGLSFSSACGSMNRVNGRENSA